MAATKVAVTIDESLLREIDRLVVNGEFPNRSRAINAALVCLQEQRQQKHRLLAELAKLDPAEEHELAEEALSAEAEWPEF
ncbi:MAG TPA: ribbon-helix-helix domain-containing protein [Chloroflexota bacterium]|jgi:Arc/MetJ-type ribon-helix-helix transcriptional regulator